MYSTLSSERLRCSNEQTRDSEMLQTQIATLDYQVIARSLKSFHSFFFRLFCANDIFGKRWLDENNAVQRRTFPNEELNLSHKKMKWAPLGLAMLSRMPWPGPCDQSRTWDLEVRHETKCDVEDLWRSPVLTNFSVFWPFV